jgi:hypothetical protein
MAGWMHGCLLDFFRVGYLHANATQRQVADASGAGWHNPFGRGYVRETGLLLKGFVYWGRGAVERSLIETGLPSVGDDAPLFYPVIPEENGDGNRRGIRCENVRESSPAQEGMRGLCGLFGARSAQAEAVDGPENKKPSRIDWAF